MAVKIGMEGILGMVHCEADAIHTTSTLYSTFTNDYDGQSKSAVIFYLFTDLRTLISAQPLYVVRKVLPSRRLTPM